MRSIGVHEMFKCVVAVSVIRLLDERTERRCLLLYWTVVLETQLVDQSQFFDRSVDMVCVESGRTKLWRCFPAAKRQGDVHQHRSTVGAGEQRWSLERPHVQFRDVRRV